MTVTEVPENKRNKIVQMTEEGRIYCEKGRASYYVGGGYGNVHVHAGGAGTAY